MTAPATLLRHLLQPLAQLRVGRARPLVAHAGPVHAQDPASPSLAHFVGQLQQRPSEVRRWTRLANFACESQPSPALSFRRTLPDRTVRERFWSPDLRLQRAKHRPLAAHSGDAMSIYQLVNEISSGEIVLPAIQRDFVWSSDRVELLFDSLLRGYPVGIVLLWETYTPMQYRRFVADYQKESINTFDENKGKGRLRLVLDGQQRLSSIYVALKGTYEGKRLYYDVLSGHDRDDHSEVKYGFRFLSNSEADQLNESHAKRATLPDTHDAEGMSHWLRLSDITGIDPPSLTRLRKGLKERLGLSAETETRLEINLNAAIYALASNGELLKTQTIDSNLPAEDHKRKSAFDILEIFVRINTQGMPLRRSDLIVSMLRLYWPEASTVLPVLIKELNSGSNFAVDTDFVIRCMFSTAGLGTRLDFELLRKKSNIDAIRSGYEKCFDAIRSVLDFVRTECGIDSSRLIGGISTLIPFIYFVFHTQKQSIPKSSLESARRSVFLFAFSRALGQHAESRTSAFIRDHLPTEIEIANGATFPYEEAVRFVGWRSGFVEADVRLFANNLELALAILHKRAGGKVYHDGNTPEIDHIFPKSVLAEKGFDHQDINDLGNFWLLPRELNRNKSAQHPKDYLRSVSDNVLTRSLIERNSLDYRQYRRFIRERRDMMIALIRKYTGIGEADFSIFRDTEE